MTERTDGLNDKTGRKGFDEWLTLSVKRWLVIPHRQAGVSPTSCPQIGHLSGWASTGEVTQKRADPIADGSLHRGVVLTN